MHQFPGFPGTQAIPGFPGFPGPLVTMKYLIEQAEG